MMKIKNSNLVCCIMAICILFSIIPYRAISDKCRLFTTIKNTSSNQFWREQFRHGDAPMREAAISVLIGRDPDSAISHEILDKAMSDPDSEVRQTAVTWKKALASHQHQ